MLKIANAQSNGDKNKLTNGKGNIITDTEEIERIIRQYCRQLYGNKFENLEEMKKKTGKK